MKIKEEQLANNEECYKNRMKMETREKQGKQGKKILIGTVFDFLRFKMKRECFFSVCFFLQIQVINVSFYQ